MFVQEQLPSFGNVAARLVSLKNLPLASTPSRQMCSAKNPPMYDGSILQNAMVVGYRNEGRRRVAGRGRDARAERRVQEQNGHS